MRPEDFTKLARHIIEQGRGRPSQASLRRALSTVYHALFHALARNGADELVGKTGALRASAAWQLAYRGIEHGRAKTVFRNASLMTQFSPAIQDFGDFFVAMQQRRQLADYHPDEHFAKSFVVSDIDDAERLIARFRASSATDRRTLSSHILFKSRPLRE